MLVLWTVIWAWIFKLLRAPRIDSTCEKSIPLWSWFLEASMPCEKNRRLQNCHRHILSVWEGDPYWSTHFQHANNMAAVGKRWKVDSCLKNNILWDMAYTTPYWVPTQFQESIFPPHNPFKNIGSVLGWNNNNNNVLINQPQPLCHIAPQYAIVETMYSDIVIIYHVKI